MRYHCIVLSLQRCQPTTMSRNIDSTIQTKFQSSLDPVYNSRALELQLQET